VSETVEKLLDEAENRIRLRGYHAVSFRDLAEALEIKSSSVHYHFPHKEDLGVSVVERYAERMFAALEAEAAGARNAAERIRALCRVYRHALTSSDKICLCGMLGAESLGLPPVMAETVAAFFKANVDWVAKALPDTLSRTQRQRKARHIIAALQGAMILASSLRDHKVFDDAVRDLLSALELELS